MASNPNGLNRKAEIGTVVDGHNGNEFSVLVKDWVFTCD